MTINIVAADGTGLVSSLPCPGDYCEPTDWSADCSSLLLTVQESGNSDVWSVSTEGEGAAKPVLDAAYDEMDARYSPDGRWVAYVSTEAGQPQVMVHTVSGPPRRMVVSGEGGAQPVWRHDGKMLYFVNLAGRLQSVAVHWAGNGDPSLAFRPNRTCQKSGSGIGGRNTTSRPTAAACISCRPTEELPPHEIQVAINWRTLLD
jgi:Tol biopolymer transport system component